MTETVRYLETRLVAPHPPGFPHQQKQCSFLRARAGAHAAHKKQFHPTPVEHIDSHKNYVYILFDLPVLVVTVTGWVVDPMYIKSQPPKSIIYLLTVGVALVVNVGIYTRPMECLCIYTYYTYIMYST